jgi:hypothetical protein
MTFEVSILAWSISISDRSKSAANIWMQKGLYPRSQDEKLLGFLEQYECQDVGDAVKPNPVYIVDSYGFYKAHSAGLMGREMEVLRAWVNFASAKVVAVPITYCQYRYGSVGHCSPRKSPVVSHAPSMSSGCASYSWG